MKSLRSNGTLLLTCLGIAVVALAGVLAAPVFAQTALGELEGRPAPVALRRCVAGANAGSICNENADCPGSTCVDRNVFNISVAIHFNATAAQLTAIQNMITAGSALVFDATDGQAEIGQATLHNNAFGTTQADVRVYPATTPTWWQANTGSWKAGGSIHVSIDNILAAGAVGESFGHEFLHLAFDPRDEYERRAAGCGAATPNDSCPEPAALHWFFFSFIVGVSRTHRIPLPDGGRASARLATRSVAPSEVHPERVSAANELGISALERGFMNRSHENVAG